MNRRIETLRIVSEKITPNGLVQAEIACVPFRTGVHEMEGKFLELTVGGVDVQDRQKCIIKGNLIPTIQQPGKKKENTQARRVIDVPKYENKSVKQDRGTDEKIVFHFEKSAQKSVRFVAD